MKCRYDIRRQIAARILLIVFGTMLAMSSLHVHTDYHDVAADCTECQHNVHHSGHLSSAVFDLDDCVLCQFAALSFILALLSSVIFFVNLYRETCVNSSQQLTAVTVCCNRLRGPPFLF